MYYLGIDLGGTNIAAGVVDEEMKLVYKTSIPTESKGGAESVIKRMAEVAYPFFRNSLLWIMMPMPAR